MATLRVIIPVKFTQSNLDKILFTYFEAAKHPKYSSVIFDLSVLEWIQTEEIAFLFAWIREVSSLKTVEVWMPYPNVFNILHLYEDLADHQLIASLIRDESDKNIQRRRNRNIFLLSVWGMLENVGLPDRSFKHVLEGFNKKRGLIIEKYSHLIIPFNVISSKKPTNVLANTFSEFISGEIVLNQHNSVGPFDLDQDIINTLDAFKCYSPFESKIISHVITKELFANSLVHAGLLKKDYNDECYFALSLNNRRPTDENYPLLKQFYEEKDPDTLDFYKNKKQILNEVIAKAVNIPESPISAYTNFKEVGLSEYSESFKNFSYLEFTFLDFGSGIVNTLKNKFDEFIENKENKKSLKSRSREQQILEYAFYPESSRSQFDVRLENPELFPRGLYFLMDMVRRYKGLLVVRSGSGKVVYDFSDKIYARKSGSKVSVYVEPVLTVTDAIRDTGTDSAFFDGTMISIVLPEKIKSELSYDPVRYDNRPMIWDISFAKDADILPKKIFKAESYEYISMLFLYEKAITKIEPKELARTKGFDSYVYIELLKELKKLSHKKCIVFIDFEYYPRTETLQQLLFYLTNSPFINEYCKAVVVNLTDNEVVLNNYKKEVYKVLHDFKLNLFAKDNEPHIFRPIPCVNFDLYDTEKLVIKSINWIGIKEEADEQLMDQLFIGEVDSVKLRALLDQGALKGNIFVNHQNEIYSIFTTSLELVRKYKAARSVAISNFINSLVVFGMREDTPGKGHVFQASRGSFQTNYLSLYETLHNKYLAEFFAKRLLDDYLLGKTDNDIVKFDKIITVTVSSQLVGVAIRDLIKNDPTYIRLKTGTGSTLEDCPTLIILSSYYSFEDEKPFKRILKNDSVLIVNDVISTGSLVAKLIERIEKGKSAKVQGVMSVCDCRLDNVDKTIEVESMINKNKQHLFYTLVGYPKGDLIIRKFRTKQILIDDLEKKFGIVINDSDIDVKRINPLLNTVVELSDKYGEKEKILFPDLKEFLPEKKENRLAYQTDYFKIGHFVQNLSHNGYLTNMKSLFSEDEGKRIIQEIKNKMDNDYHLMFPTISDDSTNLFSIQSLVEQLDDDDLAKEFSKIIEKGFSKNLDAGFVTSKKTFNYQPDFIFYPVFSGIENFPQDDLHKIFRTELENIIGMQRFDTDKGWRFPFPPKRFNNVTKGKHILILDSGALTGESLIQMIDSISFLEVGKIDMISVVGRIEDYNREFFSRIKAIKIKSLGDKKKKDGHTPPSITSGRKVSLANINIILGINLHIPVYASKSTCPFCEEINELEFFKGKYHEDHFPISSKNYIETRLIELKKIDLGVDGKCAIPDYLPLNRRSQGFKHDIISLFSMRNRLGKIDSYRFYREYYKPFDEEIINKLDENDIFGKTKVLRNIELILICILHEPKLFKVHKDLLVNIHVECINLLERIIVDYTLLDKLYYKWTKYAIVRLYLLFFGRQMVLVSDHEKLLRFINDDEKSLCYISYIFQQALRNLAFDTERVNEPLLNILIGIDYKFDNEPDSHPIYRNDKIREIIRNLVKYIHPSTSENVNDSFLILRHFFKNIFPNADHNNLRGTFGTFKTVTNNFDFFDLEYIFKLTTEIVNALKVYLINNLTTIHNNLALKTAAEDIYNDLFTYEGCIFKTLTELQQSHEDLNKLIKNNTADQRGKIAAVVKFRTILLDKLQYAHLKENNSFNKFCEGYIFHFKKCLDQAMKDESFIKHKLSNPTFNVINTIDIDFLISGHYDYVLRAVREILINAAKRLDIMDCTLTISHKLNPIDNSFTVTFYQDKAFQENKSNHIGGTENIIKPVFEIFFGKKNLVIEKGPDFYLISIKFVNSLISLK